MGIKRACGMLDLKGEVGGRRKVWN